jgi:CTP synthase
VAIVGKYVSLPDAYLSAVEALRHAGIALEAQVEVSWVDSEQLEDVDDLDKVFSGIQGIIVPGGFGCRGVEGKILAARYARENKIPFFGLCLGLQCAVVEYARSVLGLSDAHTTECDPNTPHPVVKCLPGQEGVTELGGTMRLGALPCRVSDGSLAKAAYQTDVIYERHRHRYEVNAEYKDMLEAKGLIVSGTSLDGRHIEIMELKDHPWFLGTQYHPEFKSRPNRPHPLFSGFLKAILDCAGFNQ